MKRESKRRRSSAPGKRRKTEVAAAMTRREWLQSLGGAALAAGFPSVPRAAAAAARTGQEIPARPGLPPGLYQPSPDHLGHALESNGRFHVIPPGTQTGYARPVAGNFKPLFFSSDEYRRIRRCVVVVLGLPLRTENETDRREGKDGVVEDVAQWIDLSVASAAGVSDAARALSSAHRTLAAHYFGTGPVNELEREDLGKTCRDGLAWLDEGSRQKYGANFLNLTEAQQTGIIDDASDVRAEAGAENSGTRFFQFLKREAIRGYYTSRVGLEELDDKGNAFYTVSPGCADAQTVEQHH